MAQVPRPMFARPLSSPPRPRSKGFGCPPRLPPPPGTVDGWEVGKLEGGSQQCEPRGRRTGYRGRWQGPWSHPVGCWPVLVGTVGLMSSGPAGYVPSHVVARGAQGPKGEGVQHSVEVDLKEATWSRQRALAHSWLPREAFHVRTGPQLLIPADAVVHWWCTRARPCLSASGIRAFWSGASSVSRVSASGAAKQRGIWATDGLRWAPVTGEAPPQALHPPLVNTSVPSQSVRRHGAHTEPVRRSPV